MLVPAVPAMAADFTLSGQVTGSDSSQPIENVAVELNYQGFVLGTDVTDESGNYQLLVSDLVVGFTLTIKADPPVGSGYLTGQESISLTQSTVRNISLSPAPATSLIGGTIFDDETGQAIPGALVEMIEDDTANVVASTISNSNSGGLIPNYIITNVPYGIYDVRVTLPAGYEDRELVSPESLQNIELDGDKSVSIHFHIPQVLFGKVTGVHDEPIAGAVVSWDLFNFHDQTTTDSEGNFSMPIVDQTFLVTITPPQGSGYQVWSDNVGVVGSTEINVTLTPSDTSAPVIGYGLSAQPNAAGWYSAPVTISWGVSDPDSPIYSQTDCGETVASSDTPSEGTTYTCEATSVGGTDSESVTLKIDKTAPNSFTMLDPLNGAIVSGVHRFTFQIVDNASGVKKIVANVGGVSYSWLDTNQGASTIKKDPNDPNGWYIDVNTNNLPNGTNHIVLRATDKADNVKYWNNRKDLHSFVVQN